MDLLSQPLLIIGKNTITWWSLLYVSFMFLLLFLSTSRFQQGILSLAKKRPEIDIGIVTGISILARYFCLAVGFIVILQTAGIDLSSLTIIAGGIGLGLTVGLQKMVANFMSGVTLFLERPIKVGDRVEVDGVLGDVTKMSFRATTICTDDNIEIIVPNSHFITDKVTNWSHSSPQIRLTIPISVARNADPRQVKGLIEHIALRQQGVLTDPPPELLFTRFGESSLDFTLLVWTSAYTRQPFVLRSDLYYEIFDRLKAEGIEIPFPQRDVHIRSHVAATPNLN